MPCKGTTWDCIAQHVNSHVQAIAWDFTWFHHVSLFGKRSKMRTKHPESLRKRLTPPQATFKTASENETSSYLTVTVHLISQPWFSPLEPNRPGVSQLGAQNISKYINHTNLKPSHVRKCMSQRTSESSPNFLQPLPGAQLVPLKPVTSVGVGLQGHPDVGVGDFVGDLKHLKLSEGPCSNKTDGMVVFFLESPIWTCSAPCAENADSSATMDLEKLPTKQILGVKWPISTQCGHCMPLPLRPTEALTDMDSHHCLLAFLHSLGWEVAGTWWRSWMVIFSSPPQRNMCRDEGKTMENTSESS